MPASRRRHDDAPRARGLRMAGASRDAAAPARRERADFSYDVPIQPRWPVLLPKEDASQDSATAAPRRPLASGSLRFPVKLCLGKVLRWCLLVLACFRMLACNYLLASKCLFQASC
eukprot:365319-Chlamydomonas_euryale.AAC.19